MNLKDLIARVRTEANDTVEPYFWSDSDITQWLNDAVAEAAVRGRLIHESDNPDVCRIDIQPDTVSYPLHKSLYEIDYIALVLNGETVPRRARLVSSEWLDGNCPDWREWKGFADRSRLYLIQYEQSVRLVPRPNTSGKLLLEGYRLPLEPMNLDDQETERPEIHEAHHVHLVNWALHRGFSIPDMESFDPERAGAAEFAFTRYFGARPDSDLRRITREDVPQHVEAFWI